MPVLRSTAEDHPDHRVLQARGVDRPPPTHTLLFSEGSPAAVRARLGRGMLPELSPGTEIAGSPRGLVEEHAHHGVALHRQSWTPGSERWQRITSSTRRAGRRQLRAPQQDGRTTALRRSRPSPPGP